MERAGRFPLLLCGGAIVLLALLAYIPAMTASFVWDDDFHVTENRALREPDGLRRIWTDVRTTPQYYPLTHTTFWMQYQLWGDDPLPYHLANILLHIGSALLLWRILERLGLPGAWLAAAIFALHPVHVESVAWITERKNVLSGLFYLAAAFVYIKHKLEERSSIALPLLSLGLFFCALLSKTVTASLPVILIMVLAWKGRRFKIADGLILGTMLVSGAVMGRLTSSLERFQVGAMGAEWDLSVVERFLIAGRAWWFYLCKLIWPLKLAFVYPRWEIDAGAAWQYLYPASALAALGGLLFLRKKTGWGPLLALLCYTVTISPALGFFDVYPMRYSFVADHFQYLASIGPIAVLAAALWKIPSRSRSAAAAAVLAACTVLAFLQCRAYDDLETLWRHTVKRYDRSWMAHYNLGKILVARGELEEARGHFERALEVKPDHIKSSLELANLLADQGDLAAAIELYRASLTIDPDHALTHYNLALALEQSGRPQEALVHYRHATRIDPGLAAAHNNMAIILYNQGDYQGAARELELARKYGHEPHPDFVRELNDKLR